MWCVEVGEGWYEIYVVGMWYVGGECFDFCGCFDEVDVVV